MFLLCWLTGCQEAQETSQIVVTSTSNEYSSTTIVQEEVVKHIDEKFYEDEWIAIFVKEVIYNAHSYERPRYLILMYVNNKTDDILYLQHSRVFVGEEDVTTAAFLGEWLNPQSEKEVIFTLDERDPSQGMEDLSEGLAIGILLSDAAGQPCAKGILHIAW